MENINKSLSTIEYLSYKKHAKYYIYHVEETETYNKCYVKYFLFNGKLSSNYYEDYNREIKEGDEVISIYNEYPKKYDFKIFVNRKFYILN